MVFIKNKERYHAPRAFLLFIIFSLAVSALFAGGSGEFSKDYQEELKTTFEEAVLGIESGIMDAQGAKDSLALLRSRYKVDYNDFAGKLDALIDEVAEDKKDSREAMDEYILLKEALVRVREQEMEQDKDKTVNKSIYTNSGQGSSHGETSSGVDGHTGKNN